MSHGSVFVCYFAAATGPAAAPGTALCRDIVLSTDDPNASAPERSGGPEALPVRILNRALNRRRRALGYCSVIHSAVANYLHWTPPGTLLSILRVRVSSFLGSLEIGSIWTPSPPSGRTSKSV
uniref:Putative secreted protein n=1 Tax=Anopheles triannulatus TaxID=58253 RepID=A0A2M4B6Z3_9DIPT